MNTNAKIISDIIEYIEKHLSEELDLDTIASVSGYSKYHLHRMFTGITDLTLHSYILKRRLTEAARMLAFTQKPIADIAYYAGYDTQQSFNLAFKQMFGKSPNKYRNMKEFAPIQLKFVIYDNNDDNDYLRGDRILDIRIAASERIILAGYKANTKLGFFSIKLCWNKMHSRKKLLTNRKDYSFLIGLNDYTNSICDVQKQPAFDYYAAAEVSSMDDIPASMEKRVLPPSKYVVFSFKGRNQDSLQPAIEYIYKTWFPQSTYQLNDKARYDFAKYGEEADKNGKSEIEVWIPIL
ncbi:MAG: helix-turn-helix domain-containing protein [Bacillota bacterium]